jgi:hypothetical protein
MPKNQAISWSDGTGTLPRVVSRTPSFRSSTEVKPPRKDRHRSPLSEPVVAQGQIDKGMVEPDKVSRRKQYQSWLPKNSS